MTSRLNLENIRSASQMIDPVFLHTPQYAVESLSKRLGVRLVVKVETVNPVRCFKGRGAGYFVSRHRDEKRLVAASAGNLGQALAHACRNRGIGLTVYACRNANSFKLDRMREFGADVVLFGDDFDEAKIEAKRAAGSQGVRFVEDSLDVETGEGAGTIGVELATFGEAFDAVLLSLGNGALACGVGTYLKAVSPRTRIVAIQSAGAPAMIESWKQDKVIGYDSCSTVADGIAVRRPIPECVADLRDVIDEGILVEDATLIEAMRLAQRYLGLVLEPAGAAGLAALMENRQAFSGATVAVVLCGGNLSPEQVSQWLS